MRLPIILFLIAIAAAFTPPAARAQTEAKAAIKVTREADLPVASDQERRYWAMRVTRDEVHLTLWSLPAKDKPWTIDVINGFSLTNSHASVVELQEVLDKFEEWSDLAATNTVGDLTKVIKNTQTAFGARVFEFVVGNDKPPKLSISDGPDLSEDDVAAIQNLLDEYPGAMAEWKAKLEESEHAAELFK
jgi:hypothetical protein